MEGSYSRVWSLCRPSSSSASLPLPESLPVRDARTLLFLESDQEVQEFAQSVRPISRALVPARLS